MFADAGVSRRMTIDTQLSAAVCRIVSEGGGVSLVEPVTARDFCERGELVARAFRPEITFQYSVLFPVHRSRSLLCTEFLELVKSELAPGDAPG